MKVIGLAGWSGAGKTTLLTRLIPHFNAQGLRVSVIKHA
ncbi:molybdopterin-guanine dinucleotide biosynthesis protein MobB, partial [Herbaspirillum sp. HC18]